MIILDTNVVSELMRAEADHNVVAWLDGQPAEEVYLTAVTGAELSYGVARMPAGRRKARLADRVRQLIGEDFAGRLLPFDEQAAEQYGSIAAMRERSGQPIAMADAQIAAICRARRAQLATRNLKDFAHTGIDVIDPWSAAQDPPTALR